MQTREILKIGIGFQNGLLQGAFISNVFNYLSRKTNFKGKIILELADYLVKYKKKFDDVYVVSCDSWSRFHPNGILIGLFGHLNRSQFDIGFPLTVMKEEYMEHMDFSYPFKLYSHTFVIPKPEYKPQIFGIFQTFSLSVWISVLSVIAAIVLVHYVMLKSKFSFKKIFFNVLAVFLRQNSTVNPSSIAENFVVYSWIVGAMFLCLAYDSVFLSFLSFPPITNIKNVEELANAVENGDYHCVAGPTSAVHKLFLNTKEKKLLIIGKDVMTNNLSTVSAFTDFIRESGKQNLAYLLEKDSVDYFAGKYFVSDDHFYDVAASFLVRKDFCCKKLLETFVHRIMASGLLFKFKSDSNFLYGLPLLLNVPEKDTSNRKLTLTDVAPAFMFLLAGYLISTLVVVGEILSHRKNKVFPLKENKRIKNKNAPSEISV